MRVLITGGSGFIGRHLSALLRERGHSTRILDLEVSKDPSSDYIMGDIRSPDSLSGAFEGIDSVVHLAALISVEDSFKRPAEYFNTNVTGTINVMRACAGKGVRRFVHISSAAVYGNPAELPLKETSPVNPRSSYGETKLASELCVRSFCGSYGLENVILRIFNAYGPGQLPNDYSGVITKFVDRLRKGQAPIVFGDGEQSRDFIHVHDATEAIALALEGRISGETLNIATGIPSTINSVAQSLIALSKRQRLEPLHVASRKGDIKSSYADISRAKRLLNFSPKIDLNEGLRGLYQAR